MTFLQYFGASFILLVFLFKLFGHIGGAFTGQVKFYINGSAGNIAAAILDLFAIGTIISLYFTR